MKIVSIVLCGAAALGFAVPVSVEASSPDAWEQFRNDVAAACRTALELEADAPVKVSAFGSEHFGFAVAEGEKGPLACVYDKADKTVEVETEFTDLPKTGLD